MKVLKLCPPRPDLSFQVQDEQVNFPLEFYNVNEFFKAFEQIILPRQPPGTRSSLDLCFYSIETISLIQTGICNMGTLVLQPLPTPFPENLPNWAFLEDRFCYPLL